MKKQYAILLFFTLFILLVLAGCKSSGGANIENIEEKRACFKKCMLIEEDEAYCLDDCDMNKEDVIEKPKIVCGDSVCQQEEKQKNLCPQDCGECATDSDCVGEKICEESQCISVDCTEDGHCPDGYVCMNNACEQEEEELDTAAVEELKDAITALSEDIDTLIEEIMALQDDLDGADAADDDKKTIQDDIDALNTVLNQLKTYNRTIVGYADDLEDVKTNSDLTLIEDTFDAEKEDIKSYLEEQKAEVDSIEEAIAGLEPEAEPDLAIEDLDLESVDGNDATFTITFKNDDEGYITVEDSFRVKITSYNEDNETVDDSKTTFEEGLEPDEEGEAELEVEMEHDPENYFTSNPNATSLVVLFLVELDIDETINESNEDNNNEYFNITFEREDYVSNTAPAASISANATSVMVSEEISFDATNSTDPDGSISIYNWNFGDGYSSANSAATHSYITAGTYTVTLTVTDDDSATDTETVTITVS